MKPSDVLKLKKNWVKNSYANRQDGSSCSVESDNAVCWCLVGAIMKCYPHPKTQVEKRLKASSAMKKLFPGRTNSLLQFNDHKDTKFTDVKKVLKEAEL